MSMIYSVKLSHPLSGTKNVQYVYVYVHTHTHIFALFYT